MSFFTLCKPAVVSGWAIATGRRVRVRVFPGPPESGVTINGIPAEIDYARSGEHCTTLKKGGKRVRMCEHLLAALYGLGVTDIGVEVNADELPLSDGSARPFVRLLQRAGLLKKGNRSGVWKVPVPVGITRGGRFLIVLPGTGLRINCIFELPGVFSPPQYFSCRVTREFFAREIAPARTFGRVAIPHRYLPFAIRSVNGWSFPARPRFAGEAVRHKVLDLIGDIALLGCPIEAEVIAYNPGHQLNLALVRRLKQLKREERWQKR